MFGIRKRLSNEQRIDLLEQDYKNLSEELCLFKHIMHVIPIPTTIVADKYVIWADKSYTKVHRQDLACICHYYNNTYTRNKCKAKILSDDDVSFVIEIKVYHDYYTYDVFGDVKKNKPQICHYRIIKSTGERQVLNPELIKELHETLNKEED